MVEVQHAAPAEERSDDFGGYRQELRRTLGPFQVFAISFAFISVAVGIFGTYDDVLKNAGPAGIWLWPIVAVGQTLIALVIAQFAARIPLSGSSYQWASRLANPKIGWLFGWLSFCYLAAGVVTVANAMASTALMPLFGMQPDENTARVITLVVLVIQAVLVVLSTRLVGVITSAAVGLELVIVVVLTIGLFVAVAVTGDGAVSNLTSRGITEGAPDYFAIGGGLMAAMIMGIATLVGFDAAANMAEEAKDPFRNVPRAIVGSVVAAAVLGMVFVIALTIAIKDIPRASATNSPVALIMSDQLGPVVERSLLVAIVFAFFGAGLVTLVTCARMVFAMSRDSRFPGHQLMRRVNPRNANPDSGDHLDRRRRIRPDGRAGRWCIAEVAHGGRAHRGGPLRRDHRALSRGAETVGTPGERVRSRAFRHAGCDRRAGVVGPRGVRARIAARGLDRRLDFGRRARRRRRVLGLLVDVQPQSTRDRARRHQSRRALTDVVICRRALTDVVIQ